VRSGALEAQLFVRDLIDQDPIRFDVGISETLPFALERMVFEPGRFFELIHIFAAFLGPLDVPLKLAGVNELPRQMPN